MTTAPKAAKKSPAQVKAGAAYAAAGRAAQAKTRAAAIKATGKPPPRSKAQKAAAAKWAKSGRAAQAAVKAGKAPVKKAALPASTMATEPVLWLPGCNDELPTCTVVAIANSLLAATGITAADADILGLYELAGGSDGTTISTALDAAAEAGLAGIHLVRYEIADVITPGMVVGVQTRRGYHAVLSHLFGLVSWGMVLPHFGEPQEAWELEWDLDHA